MSVGTLGEDIFPDAEGENSQIVAPSPATIDVTDASGEAVVFDVDYSTTPTDPTLTGLGLRMHFDSSKLAFEELTSVLPTGLIQQQDPVADAGDYDSNSSTDQYVLISWADIAGGWPGVETVILFAAHFTTLGGEGTTQVNFTASSTASGWELDASSAVVNFVAPVPAVLVNETEQSTDVTEGDASEDIYEVVLATQPTDDVTVTVVTDAEVATSDTSLVFTPENWDVPRLVTVTAVDDDVDEPDSHTGTIQHTASSNDARYDSVNVPSITVNVVDDDTVGISLNVDTTLETTEGGDGDQFTVVLDTEPTSAVAIFLASSDGTEGGVSPTSLMFTPTDWNQPRTVTVSPVNDDVDDDDVSYTISMSVTADDPKYGVLDGPSVTVTNVDDDTAGVSVNVDMPLETTEGGNGNQFTVVLDTEPMSEVTIYLTSSNGMEGSVLPTSLMFMPTNWNQPQGVTVSPVNDDVDDGDITYTISLTAVSDDPKYDETDEPSVTITNVDDDTAGISVNVDTTLETTEGGDGNQFTVVLDSRPMSEVTVTVLSDDETEGSVSPASLMFTPTNWNQPQAITVAAVDDDVDDGTITYSIDIGATADDPKYNELEGPSVTVANVDDDTAGISVNVDTTLETTEGGDGNQFTVVLDTQPMSEVTVALTVGDGTEGSLSTGVLTFTANDWDQPQAITVAAVDDDVDDGDHHLSDCYQCNGGRSEVQRVGGDQALRSQTWTTIRPGSR